jgi:D-amino peptidase
MRRLFICADIEGVAGVVSWDQTRETGHEYAKACEWMTAEAVSLAETALAQGFDEILIADSHGSAQNLILDRFPAACRIIRGWPRPLGMMQGVEQPGVEAAVLLGHHTGAADVQGQLNHTMSGAAFWDVRLNGVSVSETHVNAALAGAHGVPVILATGDSDYTAMASALLPGLTVVPVKTSVGRIAGESLIPAEACRQIACGLESALAAPPPPLFRIEGPITLDLDLKWHQPAEMLAYLPMFERTGAHGIRTVLPDICAVQRCLEFLMHYRPVPV